MGMSPIQDMNFIFELFKNFIFISFIHTSFVKQLIFSFLFQFGPQLLDTLHTGGLGYGEGDVQNALQHHPLVLAVHQSHEGARVGISSTRGHHLASWTIDSPHNLGRPGTILKLHALPTHDELLPLVAHLGQEDEVPG